MGVITNEGKFYNAKLDFEKGGEITNS